MKMEIQRTKTYGMQHSSECLPQETKHLQQPNFIPQGTKYKDSRRKEMTKIRPEINEIETKKIIEKINETKGWFLEKMNKIDKTLPILTKKREREREVSKSEMKEGILQLMPQKQMRS